MSIELSTVATIGKAMAVKREKAEDETEVTRCHLKFSDLFLTREQVNAICGQGAGWAETSFYDEGGAPLGRWTLALEDAEYTMAGLIAGPSGDGLHFTTATVDGLAVAFTKLGALLSGQIAWLVAGDEAGDAEALLGRECRATLVLTDGGQQDMLRSKAA